MAAEATGLWFRAVSSFRAVARRAGADAGTVGGVQQHEQRTEQRHGAGRAHRLLADVALDTISGTPEDFVRRIARAGHICAEVRLRRGLRMG
jgi:hypothetical protein